MMLRTSALVATVVLGGSLFAATPAHAGHDHYVLTPNGECRKVAHGQTGIDDDSHGGYHRFHENVHLGATESTTDPDSLGDGRGQVRVYKDRCP